MDESFLTVCRGAMTVTRVEFVDVNLFDREKFPNAPQFFWDNPQIDRMTLRLNKLSSGSLFRNAHNIPYGVPNVNIMSMKFDSQPLDDKCIENLRNLFQDVINLDYMPTSLTLAHVLCIMGSSLLHSLTCVVSGSDARLLAGTSLITSLCCISTPQSPSPHIRYFGSAQNYEFVHVHISNRPTV